jgi:hypothetical protein
MSPVRTRSQEALDQAAEESRDLEIAHALAEEEAEIGRRLPSEVLNINKKTGKIAAISRFAAR